jgi:hypothetical protein
MLKLSPANRFVAHYSPVFVITATVVGLALGNALLCTRKLCFDRPARPYDP